MRSYDEDLVSVIADPAELPNACAICSWLDGDLIAEKAPQKARELLGDTESLSIAIQIRDAVLILQSRAFDEFWSGVQANILNLIAKHGCRGWTAKLSCVPNDSYLSIVPSAGLEMINSLYHVCVEGLCVPTGRDPAFFGVWKSDLVEAHDATLQAILKQEGFKANAQWTGWKWFSRCGLPEFTLTPGNLIRINADNHTIDRPLADQVTQTLWQVFQIHRLTLEQLDQQLLGPAHMNCFG